MRSPLPKFFQKPCFTQTWTRAVNIYFLLSAVQAAILESIGRAKHAAGAPANTQQQQPGTTKKTDKMIWQEIQQTGVSSKHCQMCEITKLEEINKRKSTWLVSEIV